MEDNIKEIVVNIQQDNFGLISDDKLSERKLKEIALTLKKKEKESISILIDHILENNINEECDWNIGSILQHMDYDKIIEKLKEVPTNKKAYLYDSIGLTWALGETDTKNSYIVDFLYEALNCARNSEAWWKAAFAIEKLTTKNAINNLKRSLKNHGINDIDKCLSNLSDKRNTIGILFHANNMDIKKKIYPELKRQFFEKKDPKTFLNILWLFGRLRLFDNEIYAETIKILNKTDEYEMIYYIFHSMIEDPKKIFYDTFLSRLNDEDPLIRKMALKGLAEINQDVDLNILEKMLITEENPSVIGEITKTIYKIKNNEMRHNQNLIKKNVVNENGLIGDDSDKWYADAGIYNVFSEAEDIENVCFNLILQKLKDEKIKIKNPIDLATGTGRTVKNILNNIAYEGTLYALDYSKHMLDYLQKVIDRQKYYVNKIKLKQGKIEDFELPGDKKSSLIISSFGFPSKISDKERCKRELKAVYNALSEDGVFITIGWDETFNDELNEMWYRYIPDGIKANSFYEWQQKRSKQIKSPRNCYLNWYKKNMKVALQFVSIEESINVMGHLFGMDAAIDILKNKQKQWWMVMGITYDTKETLKQALRKLGEKV